MLTKHLVWHQINLFKWNKKIWINLTNKKNKRCHHLLLQGLNLCKTIRRSSHHLIKILIIYKLQVHLIRRRVALNLWISSLIMKIDNLLFQQSKEFKINKLMKRKTLSSWINKRNKKSNRRILLSHQDSQVSIQRNSLLETIKSPNSKKTLSQNSKSNHHREPNLSMHKSNSKTRTKNQDLTKANKLWMTNSQWKINPLLLEVTSVTKDKTMRVLKTVSQKIKTLKTWPKIPKVRNLPQTKNLLQALSTANKVENSLQSLTRTIRTQWRTQVHNMLTRELVKTRTWKCQVTMISKWKLEILQNNKTKKKTLLTRKAQTQVKMLKQVLLKASLKKSKVRCKKTFSRRMLIETKINN